MIRWQPGEKMQAFYRGFAEAHIKFCEQCKRSVESKDEVVARDKRPHEG